MYYYYLLTNYRNIFNDLFKNCFTIIFFRYGTLLNLLITPEMYLFLNVFTEWH